MRPASTTNLSFSSSDGSQQPATYERLGTDSTALASWNDGSSHGQSFGTPQSYERMSTVHSNNSTSAQEEAFATARSAEPMTGRTQLTMSSTQKPAPEPAQSYPTESSGSEKDHLEDRDSPLTQGTLKRRLPISQSMGTLPPAHDDRPSPSEGQASTTVTPTSTPPLNPSRPALQPPHLPHLPRLQLPQSSSRVLVPLLESPLRSPTPSPDSDDTADSVNSPLTKAASPLAGKPAARQVSFSQPRHGDEEETRERTIPRGAAQDVFRAPAFLSRTPDSSDARRNSNSTNSGPSSPPRRKTSTSMASVRVPERRYTLAPDTPDLPVVANNTLQPSSHLTRASSSPAAAEFTAAAAPKASEATPTGAKPEGRGGGGLWSWYEAAKNRVASHTDRINSYLDGLIDPLAAGEEASAATRDIAGSDDEQSVLDAIEGVPSPRRYGLLNGPAEDHQPYGGGGSSAPRRLVEQVFLNDSHEPIITSGPMARVVELDSADLDDGDMTDVDAEQPMFEIDLVSAFHGYRSSPNECFGHLVAAALTSRSEERPVTGAELCEAARNPYLVRMVLSSSYLDFEDPVAVSEVQATLDGMLNEDDPDISPALHEYLAVFFRPPFIRLSQRQYTILKQSGFEYVVLLYHHRHVLPPVQFHSILFNYSAAMRVCNLVIMIISSAAMIMHNVAMLLVLANWMIEDDNAHQRFGFYTLIVYGCGYAVNLVMLIFLMRTRQDTFLYDESADPGSRSDTPSPYVTVVPVLPIFDVLCVVQYVRAWRSDRLIAMHNVLVSSRLSSICFSIVFGMAQFIAQSYFYHTLQSPEFDLHTDWHYALLAVASIVQWGISLFRFAWMMLSYDSITGVGFTRFNIPYRFSALERHSAVVHVLHYLMVFVLENNIYLLVAAALTRADYDECAFLPNVVISLASVSIVYGLVVYGVLIFSSIPAAKVSFSCVPLALLQVGQFVVTVIRYNGPCLAFERRTMYNGFIFGYIHWCGYIAVFIVWLFWLGLWVSYRIYKTNLYPRFNGPWKRPVAAGGDAKPLSTGTDTDDSGTGERPASATTTS